MHLDPSDIYRSDGKHPDGVSIVPWKQEIWYGMSHVLTPLPLL